MPSKRRLPLVGAKQPAPDPPEPPRHPTREDLFRTHFAPLYPPGVSLDVLRKEDANPARNPAILDELADTARRFARLAPQALNAPDLDLDFSDASIHRLAPLCDRAFRDRAIEERAGDSSLFVLFVVHASAYLGECARRGREGAWQVRRPLWESRVALSGPAGTFELAPFSIWLGVFSEGEIERRTLGDRYRTTVEAPTFDGAALPRFLEPRALPTLRTPRYDVLVKYLHTHLPEVRDLGADFPSKERFGELGFRALDFVIVGEGRALVMVGTTASGIHLFWIGRDGFDKSWYVEADTAGPTGLVDRGALLELTFTSPASRRPQVQEFLWWGP